MKKYGYASVIVGFIVGAASLYMLGTSETARHVDSYIVQWADASATTRPQIKNVQSASVVDSLKWIKALNVDTTCAFDIYPYMSLFVHLNDTSSSDSVQSVIDFYVSANNQYRRGKLPIFSEYRRAARFVASSDTVFNLTNTPIPIGTSGYFRVAGGGANKKTSFVKNKYTLSGL